MSKVKIGVIIATSMSRIDSLFNRSLNSVLKQSYQPDCIVVIDDNKDSAISDEIKRRIYSIKNPLIYYRKNSHTPNMSGTGAWNTGIYFLAEKLGNDSYFAILDDDDSWDETYLENIFSIINKNFTTVAIFAFLKRSDLDKVSQFNNNDLTVKKFLIGNPGIQGSNMCFKIASILDINGFDERLASCTDRDLMIRFLQKHGNKKIGIIPKKLINHFAGDKTVTSDIDKKKEGLDYFYKKYINFFDIPTLEESLIRAEKLFNYSGRVEIMEYYKANKNYERL